jgi:predicted RNase H-like HicB family nuclease
MAIDYRHRISEAAMTLQIELEQEADGRWIAEVGSLPGVLAYGTTRTDALAKVQALALRVLADRLEHGEAVAEVLNVAFQAA